MANELRELQLQGDSTVYKLNDARITTTAVTTATHILTTNSGVTSIAPITAANLASVLGGNLIPGKLARQGAADGELVHIMLLPSWSKCVVSLNVFGGSQPQTNHKTAILAFNNRNSALVCYRMCESSTVDTMEIYYDSDPSTKDMNIYVRNPYDYPAVQCCLMNDDEVLYPRFVFNVQTSSVPISSLSQATIL